MKSWVCTDWHRISISVPHSIVSKSFDKKHRQGKKDNDMGDDNELRQGWQHSSKIICGCSLEAIKNVKLLNSKSRFISPFSFFCVFLFFPSFFFQKSSYFWGVSTALYKISQIFDENQGRNNWSKLTTLLPIFQQMHKCIGLTGCPIIHKYLFSDFIVWRLDE